MKFYIKFNRIHHNSFNNTSLTLAIQNNNIEIVRLLLQHEKIDVNIPRISILFFISFCF